ncbi:unnamed protein product [Ilex paraguariensis]|uniref:Uncharacterized protein n=1 Tax=Ilex paraguariensis TaxID=185542 RepID=A0ABC8TM94_9AQUA
MDQNFIMDYGSNRMVVLWKDFCQLATTTDLVECKSLIGLCMDNLRFWGAKSGSWSARRFVSVLDIMSITIVVAKFWEE